MTLYLLRLVYKARKKLDRFPGGWQPGDGSKSLPVKLTYAVHTISPEKNLFSLEKDYADVIMLTYHKRFGGVNLNGVKSTSFS